MKRSIILVLLAVLSISFSSTGFAAKKAAAKAAVTKKESAKPAATANPLLGKWSFFSQNQFFEITFAADTAIFNVRNAETYKSEKVEMKYKFSKSPIILEHKTPDGKTIKLSMKYTVKGDKLTYRFLNTKNKEIPGLYEDFSMTRASRTAKPKDADIVVEKQGGSSEKTSAVEEQKSEVISDKPAETKKDDKKSTDVVLAKGVRLQECEKDIKVNGTFIIENIWTVPVKNGKFDIIVPSNPDFGAAEAGEEIHIIRGGLFENSEAASNHLSGRGDLSITLIYSEKDGIVTSNFTDKPVTLKKGWNFVGDQKKPTIRLKCRNTN